MADRFTGGNSMDILTYDDVLGGPDQKYFKGQVFGCRLLL